MDYVNSQFGLCTGANYFVWRAVPSEISCYVWSLLLPPFLSILCFPLSLTLSSSLSPHSFLPPPSICLPFLPPFFLLTIEELPPGVTGPISPRGPDSVLHSPHPSPRLPLHPHHTLCCHGPPGSRPHNPAEAIQRTQYLRSERGSSITSIQEEKKIFIWKISGSQHSIITLGKKAHCTVLSVC